MNVSSVSNSGMSPAATERRDQLGKMEFLQLLVTQLRFQNPMNPVDDREFAAQLAQFSALEQMTELVHWARLSFGLGLMGRTITYVDSEGTVGTGTVQAVRVADGQPVLSLGETEVNIDQVLQATDS